MRDINHNARQPGAAPNGFLRLEDWRGRVTFTSVPYKATGLVKIARTDRFGTRYASLSVRGGPTGTEIYWDDDIHHGTSYTHADAARLIEDHKSKYG